MNQTPIQHNHTVTMLPRYDCPKCRHELNQAAYGTKQTKEVGV